MLNTSQYFSLYTLWPENFLWGPQTYMQNFQRGFGWSPLWKNRKIEPLHDFSYLSKKEGPKDQF